MTLEVATRGLKIFTSYELKTHWFGQFNAFCTKIMSIVNVKKNANRLDNGNSIVHGCTLVSMGFMGLVITSDNVPYYIERLEKKLKGVKQFHGDVKSLNHKLKYAKKQ